VYAHDILHKAIEMAAEDCTEWESEHYTAADIAYGNQYADYWSEEHRKTPDREKFFWRLVHRHFLGFSQHIRDGECTCDIDTIPDTYICRMAGV
jgi:hypothetical protein